MTAAVPAAPQRRERPSAPAPTPRPRLRAVPPLRPSPRAGILVAAVIALVFAILLGAVMLNSKLITGQQELDHLNTRITKAEARHDRLRLQVAQLESPSRIVEAAQAQGMVPAASTVWVLPVVPGDPATVTPSPATPDPATEPPASERATGPAATPTQPAQP